MLLRILRNFNNSKVFKRNSSLSTLFDDISIRNHNICSKTCYIFNNNIINLDYSQTKMVYNFITIKNKVCRCTMAVDFSVHN